ncbi:PREDICTED: uncharacterized protein LOC106115282 [Papilio xuthus]|uniref:Uncharacterized protein LOC106115282 n=1 Tax=Papilio xuthus TaxID=66420 RepID=A0AAJ7E5Q2_PAPXU|nr:PREDICTED: uncharacterized protein LOC106115282 [Papilio xuthus]XP_013164082.1 PREDICTED: uncharacterized protein LOC106115282 [Papilio xuthus]
MINLKGHNLPERQKELNKRVRDATKKNIPFESVRDKHEATDVDKLFKIDLASNYKNIDYILNTFKCGDSLYISRALKCSWIFEDEYSNIINPDYLHQNIFPFMSIKMKKKLLVAIYTHLKSEERIIAFYNYCIEKKLTTIAHKFLIITPDNFKLDIINKGLNLKDVWEESVFLKNFFGDSITLLEAYSKTKDGAHKVRRYLLDLRHLYSVSDVKYLDLIEIFVHIEYRMKSDELGLRMSKDIMKKHKDRVLKKPLLYLSILNKTQVVKYSTIEDAKSFAVALLPSSASNFWLDNYRRTNKYILDVIPKQEMFPFLKKIFSDAYPNEDFETCMHFYNYRFYDMFNEEEKEKWALSQIESQQEVLGPGKDFKWYQFVNFDIALEGIKKYIMITIDKEKRGEMINILVESAKTQQDLEKLFKYYYERHVNESSSNKEHFMKTVIINHNVFEFDDECWNGFNKILYSMHIYSNSGFFFMTDFRLLVVIYNIVHGKEIPEQFRDILYSGFNYLYVDKLSMEKRQILYNYLMNLYTVKIKEFDGKNYEGEERNSIRRYISSVLRVMEIFEKVKEDCPDPIMKYIKLDWENFKNHHILKEKVVVNILEEGELLRLLKKDATQMKNKFPNIKETLANTYSFRINQLLRKLKIYFAKDVAKDYLKFFLDIISDPKSNHTFIYTSVYGVFQLSDEESKVDFMFKYKPHEPKIAHEKINSQLLDIQRAICRYACYSRPPVPLSNVLMYLIGDYVHYSIPMFNYYFVNLPKPLATKFIEATLNAPLSIQKHGLRLAFKSYNAEDLKVLVLTVWKNTKNISLRLLLYKNLFEKILAEDKASQNELFEALKVFTSEVHEDDDKVIYSLLTSSKLPQRFIGDLLKTAWESVGQFKEKGANIDTQYQVLRAIKSNITLMDRKFVKESVIMPHVNEMLTDKKIQPRYKSRELSDRVKTKWALVAKYIVSVRNEEEVKDSIVLVTSIIKMCGEMWAMVHDNTYTIRLFCTNFISSLHLNSNNNFENFKYVKTIFEKVLQTVEEVLPLDEMYLTVWELRLVIITKELCSNLDLTKKDQSEKNEGGKLYDDFADEVGNLAVDLINKGQFYSSFLPQINEKLIIEIKVLARVTDEDLEVVLIAICNRLTRFKFYEIYLLALMLLPTNKEPANYDTFVDTLEKIKELDNPEILSFLLQKYIYGDFKKRRYV